MKKIKQESEESPNFLFNLFMYLRESEQMKRSQFSPEDNALMDRLAHKFYQGQAYSEEEEKEIKEMIDKGAKKESKNYTAKEKSLIKKENTPFGFIPHRLHIENNPRLNCFPFNVMFVSYKTENSERISGQALYYPDLSSFKYGKENDFVMNYLNIYGGDFWLVLSYNPKTGKYIGIKMKKDEIVGGESGESWNEFFSKFTAMGLANGEQCKFEKEGKIE